MEKTPACKFGHLFAIEVDKHADCDECPNWCECMDKSLEIDEVEIDNQQINLENNEADTTNEEFEDW